MKQMLSWARWVLVSWMMAGLGLSHAATGEYILGSGDQIRITVYQNQDLQLETRISDAGTISFPLIGNVRIGGLSTTEAEAKIAKGLKDGNFLKQPQVSILLLSASSNQVSVLGQVAKPGRFSLIAGNTKLSEVLAQAGGIISGAGSDIVVVSGQRDGKTFRKEIDFPKVFASADPEADFELRNGDAIWVDRAPQIYIYGEVQRPGAQILLRDTTLLQALASAGGLTLRGTERGIRVHRREAGGQVRIIQPAMNDPLLPNDVVYVKESLF
jgi:polysaccharide export outer membrane protein